MRRRGTRGELRTLADAYLARIDPEGRRHTISVASKWPSVAGADVDRHTLGIALRDGELLVYVDSSVWAAELSAMSEQYRVRLNEEIGQELVSRIRFAVSKKVSEEKQREQSESEAEAYYRGDREQGVELTEQERMQVEFAAAPIRDDGLREAAVRAMTRHLEWKKGTRMKNGREGRSE